MLLKDISLESPQENILYDEVLLNLAEQGLTDEVLRFWESNKYFIVLGRIGKHQEDIKIDNAQRDNVPVLRRSSGGGTVVQGQGCLNYSLILSKEKNPKISDLRKSYELILGKIIEALKQIGCNTKFFPISDIALVKNDCKISGNAQKRSKKFILHHGTILYDFDLNKIEDYLKLPKDIPEYRQDRTHLDFVANAPLSDGDIKTVIKKVFEIDREENSLNTQERDRLDLFLAQREISVSLSGA